VTRFLVLLLKLLGDRLWPLEDEETARATAATGPFAGELTICSTGVDDECRD